MHLKYCDIEDWYFRKCNYYFHRKYRKFLAKYRIYPHLRKFNKIPFKLRYRKYKEDILSQDRYVTLGVDDSRPSDIQWVMPLLEKYGFRATFNIIAEGNVSERLFVQRAQKGGHEIGDHTFLHEQYPYFSPLYNGYDPNRPDGSNQQVYPSNEDMRVDRGDGCNAFGFRLDSRVDYLNYFSDTDVFDHSALGFISPLIDEIDVKWGELTDEQCQRIRDYYSVIKNDDLCRFLDELSAEFLGTKGYSRDSFDTTKGCYTQGVFTNCKTSANYAIWDRILYLQRQYQRHYNHVKFDCAVWSMPGMRSADIFYEKNGLKYYDKSCKFVANHIANTPSGGGYIHSLRKYGYKIVCDSRQPSRLDGYDVPEMLHVMIRNAKLSKPDALTYFGERTIRVGNVINAIDNIRHRTANGVIANALYDSTYDENDIEFWTLIIEYCHCVGIKLITKSEAYDICFDHVIEKGNLIYNPMLRNTLREYMPETTELNPDGYVGLCRVEDDDGIPALVTEGETKYSHYGIPYGLITYMADVKGSGTIHIFIVRNKTKLDTEEECIANIVVDSSTYITTKTKFEILDEPPTEYECRFEGLGNKVCGLRIIYSGGLEIRNIEIRKL